MNDIRAKQNVVFSVLSLLFNTLSFALITSSPSLRKLSKFHIITSMSVANILACLAFFPADTHQALNEASYSGGKMGILLHCIHMYCMPSVLSVSLVCLGVDHTVNKVYNIGFRKKIITSVVSLIVSWSFGLLSLLPFSYMYLHANTTRDSLESLFYDYNSMSNVYNTTTKLGVQQYKRHAQVLPILMTSIWGILPLIVAFLTCALCVLLRKIKKPFPMYITTQGNSTAHNTEANIREISFLDTVVSTAVMIVLTVPFYVESLSSTTCSSREECLVVKGAQNRRTELARWSVTFILPALWMLDAEFREAFVLLCSKIGVASCVVYY